MYSLGFFKPVCILPKFRVRHTRKRRFSLKPSLYIRGRGSTLVVLFQVYTSVDAWVILNPILVD